MSAEQLILPWSDVKHEVLYRPNKGIAGANHNYKVDWLARAIPAQRNQSRS